MTPDNIAPLGALPAHLPLAADLKNAAEDWLTWLRDERRAAPHTRAAYRRDLAFFLDFLHRHLGEAIGLDSLRSLSSADLRAYIAERAANGLARASLARNLSTLRNLFRWLDRRDLVHNPALFAIRSPRLPKPVPKALEAAEALDAIGTIAALAPEPWIAARDKALLLLLYGCGLRIGEALAMNGRDAPRGDVMSVRGKGGKDRIVPVLPMVRAAIDAYRTLCPFSGGETEPLFVGRRGKRLNPGVVQRQIREVRALLGLPETATPHAFRHAFATHLLAGGGDLRTIQELLGHASLSTTQRYTAIDSRQLLRTHAEAHPRAGKSASGPSINRR